jgi:hypothetical protein
MAPTITVDAADPTTQVDGASTPATFAPLAPLSQSIQLPAVELLRKTLLEQFEAGVTAAIRQRGPVHEPEQTYPLIRALQDVRNNLQAIVDVLLAVIALVDSQQVAEAALAVGADDDGYPRKNFAVPYNGEKITFTRDVETQYETDLDQLLVAVRTLVAAYWQQEGRDPAADPEQFAREVSLVLLEDIMGKTRPKVRGMDALAVSLSSVGDDGAASIARSAHRKVGSTVKRVKIDQVTPIQEAAKPPTIARRR